MLNRVSADRDSNFDAAVIGAGFSGMLTAGHLVRMSGGTVSVALIEKKQRFARGVAYATEDLDHLLNVPAGQMGAYAQDPEHFLRWCHEQPDSCRAAGIQNVLASSFVPRKLYGDYLEELLENTRRRWPSLRLLQEEAADLRLRPNGQFIVEFVGGRTLNAAKVVLALGNFPPGDPELRDQRFHNWRAVIDALRPSTQKIWQRWDWVERRKFLRHLRAYWESHRHRASPEALAIKKNLETRGRLACYRGRVLSIIENAAGLEVEFVEFRRCEPKRLQVSYVVNCTGPECNYHKLKDPLALQLFLCGLIAPDPLFLGIDVGVRGIIYNVHGERVPNLYTLGSPQKGRLLETTAVPELRVQSEDLAKRLWREIRRPELAGVEAGFGNPALAYEI